MIKNCIKKSIIIGIIILFIGTSVISATNLNIKKDKNFIKETQLCIDSFNIYDIIYQISYIFKMGQYVQQTSDNGYIVTGYNGEIDVSDPGIYSKINTVLMKYDSNGNKQWSKTFELAGANEGSSVKQIDQNGYIICGSIVLSNKTNAMILRTDGQGNEEWMKTYEGLGYAQGTRIQQTDDNGFVFTGSTKSEEDNISHMLLLKTDENGNQEWFKTYEFGYSSIGNSVQQTKDYGYIICGFIISQDKLNSSILVVKTDENGNSEWFKTYKYMDINRGYSIQQTNDQGFIIGGYMVSSFGLNKLALLLKINENGNEQWHKSYSDKFGYYAQQTKDNGYILCGVSYSNYNYQALLIKTDEQGKTEWTKTYKALGNAQGIMVQQTIDNGYILTGSTIKSAISMETYILLLKTDDKGNQVWITNLNRNFFYNSFISNFLNQFFSRFPILQKIQNMA